MATDGEIDFRSFTREQLDEALERIDREHFPLDYQALTAEIERRKWEAEVAARAGITGEASVPVRYRPEFTADPKEYFRIWIVNLALTIVTLGIYSAWAKVRKLRYFYGCTVVAGSAFGYHGDPRAILRGRLIAAALAGTYLLARQTSTLATFIVLGLLALVTPWLVVKSRMFALRVTSWRGLRFDFSPDYRGAYRQLLGWLILGIATAGLLMPRFSRERYQFIVSRSRYGATAFDCHPDAGRFFKTAFAGMGLALVVGVVLGILLAVVVGVLNAAGAPPAVTRVVTTAGVAAVYAVILSVVHGYVQARNLNEVFGTTSLGPHRVVSDLRATPLISIYLTNLLALVFTLGLYTPWAQIRLARYRLEGLELEAHGSLDDFVAAAAAPVPAATGEEISSLLDVDFGF